MRVVRLTTHTTTRHRRTRKLVLLHAAPAPTQNTHAVSSRTRYNVQTRHVSDVHVKIVHNAPTAWPATRSMGTPYAVHWSATRPRRQWSHLCATHASKAYLGPRTRGVNCSRYVPQHPHSTGHTACHSRDGRDNHTVNERVSMQEVVRGCGSSGRKEDPMQERVSSGPHAGEGFVRTPRWIGFVRTPCRRGLRQDPMLERVSSPRSMIPSVAS
jgi:hypothetical protein